MESTWEKPKALVDWEAKTLALQTPVVSEPEPVKVNGSVPMETNSSAEAAQSKSDSEDDDDEQVGFIFSFLLCGEFCNLSNKIFIKRNIW